MNKKTTEKIIKSTCGICQIGCGILVHLDEGKVIKVEGDPECPLTKGFICPKGEALPEYLYHPDRLRQPLKRVGKRGEGKWQTIEWDEALDIVANALENTREEFGVESVAFVRGAAKGLQDDYLTRFGNLFGTPNITSMAHVCFRPRLNASMLTYGFFAIPDYEYPPQCILVWGNNLYENLGHVYPRLEAAQNNGAKLVFVDPKKIKGVDSADLWLNPRPGTDLALVLGMLNVIINEDLYDKHFVEQWTVGFNELREHVQDYTLEKVAKITWIPEDTIAEAARLYANSKPASIQWGNGIDSGLNSVQTARAICILRAITGNLEVPGGDLNWSQVPLADKGAPEFSKRDNISSEMRQRRIMAGYELFPMAFYALPQGLINAILYDDPYPVRSVYIYGCNPLLSFSNAKKVFDALKNLDFLAVADMFMTPTAALADVVLPVTTSLEFDSIVAPPYSIPVALVQQKVTRVGESRSDFEIYKELASKLGFEDQFWESEEQALDQLLEPCGITFDEFRKIGTLQGTKQFRTYESKGFNTPSGKVELYSNQLKEWGFDPLPVYYEHPENPFSDIAEEFPLVLTSGKSLHYRHSGGRQIKSLRSSHPEPICYINSQTGKELEINNGDWVYIETRRGRIKQKAELTKDIDSNVVWVDYAWWFPEETVDELYGWEKSNVNVLTDDSPPFNKEMGSPNLRGVICKVYKVENS